MPDKPINWLQRLGKWRTVFASWQLGTRLKGDPECDAIRDHRELSMSLRAEVNALTCLLAKKGVFAIDEFVAQLDEESRHLCREYERRFPGFRATDEGMNINVAIASDTMQGWRP